MGPSLGLGSMKLVTIDPPSSIFTIEPWHQECFCTILKWIASTLAGILVTPTWECSSACNFDALACRDPVKKIQYNATCMKQEGLLGLLSCVGMAASAAAVCVAASNVAGWTT